MMTMMIMRIAMTHMRVVTPALVPSHLEVLSHRNSQHPLIPQRPRKKAENLPTRADSATKKTTNLSRPSQYDLSSSQQDAQLKNPKPKNPKLKSPKKPKSPKSQNRKFISRLIEFEMNGEL